jgi:hypothetical protein
VGEETKEIGGSASNKSREGKIKFSGQTIAIKKVEYNSKETTYFGKGVVTTEWFHAAGRRDFIVLAKRSEAVDKFF